MRAGSVARGVAGVIQIREREHHSQWLLAPFLEQGHNRAHSEEWIRSCDHILAFEDHAN